MGDHIVRSCPLAEAVSPHPVQAAEVIRISQPDTCPPDEEKMAALSLAVQGGRLKAEFALYLAARSGLKAEELEKVYFFAFEDGPEVEELKKVFCRAVDEELTFEEIFSLAHRSGAMNMDMISSVAVQIGLHSILGEILTFGFRMAGVTGEVLSAALRSGDLVGLGIRLALQRGMSVKQILSLVKKNHCDADMVCHILVQSGIQADAVLSAAVHTKLKAKEEVHAILLQQLLASFDTRTMDDPELDEWERPAKPHYHVTEKRSDPRQEPKCPFFLFKMKASAKEAKVSWWMKKYPRFPPERPKYKYAMRVARLVTGTDGFHLEQAGKGGQPGALSFYIPSSWQPPKSIVKKGSPVPLREVAVINRLPDGDGISIMSYVYGLGVMLRDILFLLHCPSATVALSFTERSFYVSSKFKGIPLYARADLDFIDITVPVEKLIKNLYRLYQQEQQGKKIMPEKEDHQGSQELVYQREEQEREKLEAMRKRREESKKYRVLRKEMKEVVQQMKDTQRTSEEQEQHEEYDPMLLPKFLYPEDCDLVKPSEELCQSEKRHDELLADAAELSAAMIC